VLKTQICVTRPQCVKEIAYQRLGLAVLFKLISVQVKGEVLKALPCVYRFKNESFDPLPCHPTSPHPSVFCEFASAKIKILIGLMKV